MNIPGDKPRCEKICVRTFSEFHLFPRDILADEWSLPYVRDTITWLYFRRKSSGSPLLINTSQLDSRRALEIAWQSYCTATWLQPVVPRNLLPKHKQAANGAMLLFALVFTKRKGKGSLSFCEGGWSGEEICEKYSVIKSS